MKSILKKIDNLSGVDEESAKSMIKERLLKFEKAKRDFKSESATTSKQNLMQWWHEFQH